MCILFSLFHLLPANPGYFHANPSPSLELLMTTLVIWFSLQSILHYSGHWFLYNWFYYINWFYLLKTPKWPPNTHEMRSKLFSCFLMIWVLPTFSALLVPPHQHASDTMGFLLFLEQTKILCSSLSHVFIGLALLIIWKSAQMDFFRQTILDLPGQF